MDELFFTPDGHEGYYYQKFDLVGMFYAQDRAKLRKTLHINKTLSLVREPYNKYDKNAVAVYTEDGNRLGYVPQAENEELAALMDYGLKFNCKIIRMRQKLTSTALVLAVFCISPRESFMGAIEKWRRHTLINEINKE